MCAYSVLFIACYLQYIYISYYIHMLATEVHVFTHVTMIVGASICFIYVYISDGCYAKYTQAYAHFSCTYLSSMFLYTMHKCLYKFHIDLLQDRSARRLPQLPPFLLCFCFRHTAVPGFPHHVHV